VTPCPRRESQSGKKGAETTKPLEFFLFLWKNKRNMRNRRCILFSAALLVLACAVPAAGEKISLKISYSAGSIRPADMNAWISSYNRQWQDWKDLQGGQLEGSFPEFSYGAEFEVELRIPLIHGLAFNLAGSYFHDSAEGMISFQHGGKAQEESNFLRNEVRAIPLKIGFSYVFPFPHLRGLHLLGGLGRHIAFIQYDTLDDYLLEVSSFGQTFSYNLKQDSSFRSEALGVYAFLGAEYDLIRQIAVVVEAEKVWSSADGFKGKAVKEFIERNPLEEIRETETSKDSLYFYEQKPFWSDHFYQVFRGRRVKPDKPEDYPPGTVDVRDVRQGIIDLGGFTFKIGVRFKF